ncbi:MAG: hypothetical protein ACXABY_22405 [Candidatus Thorarchaeota archaeon]|jgi:hypothetical protein
MQGIGYRTNSPYSLDQIKNAGGPAATAKSQHATLLDEKGRLVVVVAPDTTVPTTPGTPAPPVADVLKSISTSGVVDTYVPLPAEACQAVIVRNPTNKFIRVAITGTAWGSSDYITISPNFDEEFVVPDASNLQVARDDGAATPIRLEYIVRKD